MTREERSLLLFVRGLPGSGKSTFTSILVKKTTLHNAEYLDPDKVDTKGEGYLEHISTQPPNLPEKTAIYRFLLTKAISALQVKRPVVWEQPWSWAEGIKITLDKIRNGLGFTIIVDPIIIELNIGFEEAKKRVFERYERGEHTLNAIQFVKLFQNGLEPCSNLGLPSLLLDATQCVDKLAEETENFLQTIRK